MGQLSLVLLCDKPYLVHMVLTLVHLLSILLKSPAFHSRAIYPVTFTLIADNSNRGKKSLYLAFKKFGLQKIKAIKVCVLIKDNKASESSGSSNFYPAFRDIF